MAKNNNAQVSNETTTEQEVQAPVVHTKESIMEASKGIKSVAIRALLAEGMKRGDVAKLLEIRYQHVRNVEITPIKKTA